MKESPAGGRLHYNSERSPDHLIIRIGYFLEYPQDKFYTLTRMTWSSYGTEGMLHPYRYVYGIPRALESIIQISNREHCSCLEHLLKDIKSYIAFSGARRCNMTYETYLHLIQKNSIKEEKRSIDYTY